jgi:iron complex transport system ATP-binding protein
VRDIAREKKISVIIVIHDLNLALRYSDRYLFVKDGGIFAYGGQEIMTAENISEVYGMPVLVENIRGVLMVVPMPREYPSAAAV